MRPLPSVPYDSLFLVASPFHMWLLHTTTATTGRRMGARWCWLVVLGGGGGGGGGGWAVLPGGGGGGLLTL